MWKLVAAPENLKEIVSPSSFWPEVYLKDVSRCCANPEDVSGCKVGCSLN